MAAVALRLFERYLMSGLLVAMGYAFIALFALFFFFEFLSELASINGNHYTLPLALLVSFLRVPSQVYQAIPIVVLVGALISLSQFARNSELNVLRVSGVSTVRLLMLLFKTAGIVALLTFVWGETAAPMSDRMAQEIKPMGSRTRSGLELSSGFWLKDGNVFVNIRQVKPDGKLEGLQIFEFDATRRLSAVKSALEADFLQPDLWRIRGVTETRYRFDQGADTKSIPEELWRSTLSPDILEVLNVRPDKMSAYTLFSYVSHLSANKQSSMRYQMALWKRLVYPLTCFVMVALALPFGYFQGRAAGVGLKLFAGVMLGIAYYVLDGLSSSLGLINQWSPAASSLGPSLGFMLLAVAMIWWVERR